MNRKAFIALLVFTIISIKHLWAIPAYPNKISIIVDGDTTYIQVKGDEYCKFATDESGYTILSRGNNWFYATEAEDGRVIISDYQLTSKHKIDNATKVFLENTRKGLIPTLTPDRTRAHTSSPHVEYKVQSQVNGNRKVLVILMQFRDRPFTKDLSDFQRLFNEDGYTDDGAIGSVRDYYLWTSCGQLHLDSDILGPYTTKYNMEYYGGNSMVGGNDKNPYALFEEAINEAVKEVNLADYDVNNDGYVDNVHIIYAGYGEEAGASSNAIWAHEMTFNPITIQGMKIDKYSCAPELRDNKGNGISRIGPHCHEIGHALGAMDYYDTDYETGGSYLGTGDWDIMASGSWNNDGISPADFNPYVKVYNFGWADAQILKSDTINVIESDNIFRIDTGTDNDFFLLENRDGSGFHATEPGKGLLIFHIGPQLTTKAVSNKINSSYPQQCYVVCASSTYKSPSASAVTYGKINSDGCPFPGSSGNDRFMDTTTPAALTIGGKSTGIRLEEISIEDNGIRLFAVNSNSGISDDMSGDKVTHWYEDFEKLRLPSSWNYNNLTGIGEFSVVTLLSNHETSQMPLAASGKGYLKFSTVSQNGINRHRTSGILTTTKIGLSEDKEYRISLLTRKYAKLEDATDILTISLFDRDGNILATPIQQTITNQEEWAELSAKLPDGEKEFFLGIGCDTDFGSTMFLDDIRIMEIINESKIIQSLRDEDFIIDHISNGVRILSNYATDIAIYSIDGRCHTKEKIEKKYPFDKILPKGIYVVRVGLTNKKVIIN